MVTRDSKITRKKILAAATQAFVALGPAGARVDAIAAAAGVNKRMLYHHFGDKQGLYQAVLAASHDEVGQLSPERARLLAWEGLLEPSQIGAPIEPVNEPQSKEGTDLQMFQLLQMALQVFPHVCGPEAKRLTGMMPGSDAFEAALQQLRDQVERRMVPGSSAPKAKVTLHARTTPRRNP